MKPTKKGVRNWARYILVRRLIVHLTPAEALALVRESWAPYPRDGAFTSAIFELRGRIMEWLWNERTRPCP